MLKVDLGRLERVQRLRIDRDIEAADPAWTEAGVRLADNVQVRLEAQKSAHDLVVRGRIAGAIEAECRRCLTAVRQPFDEAVTLVYRRGLGRFEAEAAELYVIGPRDREVDLLPALREHVILAVPRFPLCSESCRGLCPHCGTNRNRSTCECAVTEQDERWSALRRLAE